MAHDHDRKIFEVSQFGQHHYEALPDTCPICHDRITADSLNAKANGIANTQASHLLSTVEVIFRCPSRACRRLFIGRYEPSDRIHMQSGTPILRLHSCAPTHFSPKPLDGSIVLRFPEFVAIYNQASAAHSMKLDLVAGPGYRKALEFLIKDFLKYLHQDEDPEAIEGSKLGACIQRFKDTELHQVAKRAAWIGNDEVHRKRKWEDRDIEDLKHLLDIAVHYVAMKLKADHYLETMQEGEK